MELIVQQSLFEAFSCDIKRTGGQYLFRHHVYLK